MKRISKELLNKIKKRRIGTLAYEAKQAANTPEVRRAREIETWAHYVSFSKNTITSATPAKLTESFESGDPITSRAYFKKPIKEISTYKDFYATFEVNGKEIFKDNFGTKYASDKNYVDFDIVTSKDQRVKRLKALNELPVGKHQITVLLRAGNSAP